MFKNFKCKNRGQICETLGDAILDLLKQHSAHEKMVKPLGKLKIQPGSSVSCKQNGNIEPFRVKEVTAGRKFTRYRVNVA